MFENTYKKTLNSTNIEHTYCTYTFIHSYTLIFYYIIIIVIYFVSSFSSKKMYACDCDI